MRIGNWISKAAALAAGLLCASALAQQWPVKPVRIIVPFPPGQGADIVARLLAEKLTPAIGQQVVIDNRPGAGGALGTELLTKATPDGYTLATGGSGPLTISPSVYAKLGYDPVKDIAPIINLVWLPMVFCVHPASPIQGVQDLIRLAKQSPGEVTYGSSGIGSTAHLTVELFASIAGVKLTHITYKGSIPAFTDLVGGRITTLAESTPSVLPNVSAGRVRAIGVSTLKRTPLLPDVPTLDEQGIKGYEVMAWASLIAPAGTPVAILDRLHAEVARIIAQPDIQARFRDLAAMTAGGSREQFGAYIKSEIAKWAKVVAASGTRVEH
jgi:tripartite-type tricarboxylate transporter receptor subunit TctC